MEALLEAGANEVYTLPCGMKKSRPGILLTVLCKKEKKDEMIRLLFTHTTTIGIREALFQRYVLDRKIETIETPHGTVRKKISSGYGVTKEKYEYEDLSKLARSQNGTLLQARTEAHISEWEQKKINGSPYQ